MAKRSKMHIDEQLPNRIAEWRIKRALSQNELGEMVDTSAQQIGHLENGKRRLTTDWMEKLAKALGCAPRDLLRSEEIPQVEEFEDLDSETINHGNAIIAPEAAPPPALTSMPKDMPVLGTAECGPDGEFEMNSGEIIDLVRRPPGLIGNKWAFVIYPQGDSMEPMYFAGEPVYIDPKRPPQIGRSVLVELKPRAHENPRAMLKILVKMNSEFIDVRQLNPDNSHKPLRIPRIKIKGIYRVLSNLDLMGV